MEIKGKIIELFDTVQVTDSFQKREFVVETSKEHNDKTYTELVCFQLVQDNVDIITKYAMGQEIKVLFNLKGRKWVNPEGVEKFFNSLDAYGVYSASEDKDPPMPPVANNIPPTEPPVMTNDGPEDEVPF